MKKAQRILAALIALPLLLTVLTGCELIGALEIKLGLHDHEEYELFIEGDYSCCCITLDYALMVCKINEYIGEDKEEIIIPKTIGGHIVAGIDATAFLGCSSLKSLTIPETIEYISAFDKCGSLVELKVDENNKRYHSDGNCIIETATNTLFAGCAGSVIPDYVTSIAPYAFRGSLSLTSIVIPDSVTSIGESAFKNCTSLTGISIPDGVTSIYFDTFANCTSLTSVTIDNGVEQIFISAFYGCESLKEINYNGTVEQWKTIEIANKPFAKSAVSVVHCTDGNVRINNSQIIVKSAAVVLHFLTQKQSIRLIFWLTNNKRCGILR